MRGTLAEQPKATIYQYRLIRKMVVRRELLWSYYIIALMISAFLLVMYRLDGAIAIVVGIAATQLIHFIIIRLTLTRVDVPDYRRWGWLFTAPWVGYLPTAYIELGLFRKLHRHLLWLGLCTIAVAYPWANEAVMISLISCHLWVLVPRLVIIWQFRKMKSDGVIKIQPTDFSYYQR